MELSLEYFTEMLLSFIFGPSVVKYDMLSNNCRSKIHAVVDCPFFFSLQSMHLRPLHLSAHRINSLVKMATVFPTTGDAMVRMTVRTSLMKMLLQAVVSLET